MSMYNIIKGLITKGYSISFDPSFGDTFRATLSKYNNDEILIKCDAKASFEFMENTVFEPDILLQKILNDIEHKLAKLP